MRATAGAAVGVAGGFSGRGSRFQCLAGFHDVGNRRGNGNDLPGRAEIPARMPVAGASTSWLTLSVSTSRSASPFSTWIALVLQPGNHLAGLLGHLKLGHDHCCRHSSRSSLLWLMVVRRPDANLGPGQLTPGSHDVIHLGHRGLLQPGVVGDGHICAAQANDRCFEIGERRTLWRSWLHPPPKPPISGASWTTSSRPVFLTESMSVAESYGLSDRRSMTSSSMPSAASVSAVGANAAGP